MKTNFTNDRQGEKYLFLTYIFFFKNMANFNFNTFTNNTAFFK